MHFNEYQQHALQTAIYPGHGTTTGLTYAALGLTGEAGEVANKVKKILRDNVQPVDYREAIADEIGDIIWYVAALATELGLDVDDIAAANLDKLADRQRRGVLGGQADKR